MNKKEQQIFNKFQSLKAIQPGAGWMAFNKEHLLQKVDCTEINKEISPKKWSFVFNFRSMAVSCCAVVLVVLSGFGIVASAKNSLPGEILYPVKLLMEDVRIVFSTKNKKSMLEMEYAGRRISELCQLAASKETVSEEKVIEVVDDFQLYMASLNRRMEDAQVENETEKVAYTARNINEKVEEYKRQIKEASKDLSSEAQNNVDEALIAAEETDTESLKLMASISATSSVHIIPEEILVIKIDTKYNEIDNRFTDLDKKYQESEKYIEIQECLNTAENYFNEKDLVKTLEIIEECEVKLNELDKE